MDTPLDTLARTLGATTSRREALRALGAFTVTTGLAFAGLGFAGPADAGRTGPTVGRFAGSGTCGPPPDYGMPDFCSNSGSCLCMDTPSDGRACAELPSDISFCEAPTCTTNADCAGLGAAYFCGNPGAGFCDDGLGRCVAPCGLLDWTGTWEGTSTLGAEQVDVRFEVTDVADALNGRLYVSDPVNGASIDLGTFSGSHWGAWGSWQTATGLVVAGEFVDDAFAGTLSFPRVGSQEAFLANVSLTKVGSVGVHPDAPGHPATAAITVLPPFPNPARAGSPVTVPVDLREPSAVRVAVFDALGREVAVLHDGPAAAGVLRLPVVASLPAGAYLIRATSGTVVGTRALTIVR